MLMSPIRCVMSGIPQAVCKVKSELMIMVYPAGNAVLRSAGHLADFMAAV